jgi:glycosyltransferase involved in cell wall biosynthesis
MPNDEAKFRSIHIPKYQSIALNKKTADIALVIPVINEGQRILNQLLQIQNGKYNVDVVIVDGGSNDGSFEEFHKSIYGITTLLVKQDTGALSTQLKIAFHHCLISQYKSVITIDGNNKDDVNGIVRMSSALMEGFDFIQGSRFIKGGIERNTPMVRLLAIKFIHAPAISLSARFRFTDTTNGFRGFSIKFLNECRNEIFQEKLSRYELLAYMPVLAARKNYKCTEVPVTREYPKGGAVPTKIHGLSGYFDLLNILVKIILNRFKY